jgi:hypothetical protein
VNRADAWHDRDGTAASARESQVPIAGIRKYGRSGKVGGFAGGRHLQRGADELFGEDVPTGLDIAVLVGDYVPRFKRLLDWI